MGLFKDAFSDEQPTHADLVALRSENTELRAEVERLRRELSEERERCAKLADDLAQHHEFYDGGYEVGQKIAMAIRAGSPKR